MAKSLHDTPDIAAQYTFVWGWLHLVNHRYGTMSTGQLQVVMTLILLCDLGYNPTVTELTEITGLSKSNVSRYISREMKSGFLEEYIDKDDRRRRKLRPSKAAASELEWQGQFIEKIYKLVDKTRRAPTEQDNNLNIENMITNMRAITRDVADKH